SEHDADAADAERPPAAVAALVALHPDRQRDQREDQPPQFHHRVYGEHPRTQPPPPAPGVDRRRSYGRGHVASPVVRPTRSVRSATNWSASTWASPSILIGPAADAVVTVTLASLNSCSIGPRSLSTVCTREIGAIRRSWLIHPVCVYTAVSVASHRCT